MYPYWAWNSELSSEICDKIIEESLNFDEKIGQTFDPDTEDFSKGKNSKGRISKIRWVEKNDYIFSIVSSYFKVANRNFGFDVSSIFDVQFTEYRGDEKGHYNWHADTYINRPGFNRKLSLVVQLSEPSDYEGGVFSFFDGVPEEFKERGSIIVFPSFRPHRVEPVTKGLRRSLVSWIEGPGWR